MSNCVVTIPPCPSKTLSQSPNKLTQRVLFKISARIAWHSAFLGIARLPVALVGSFARVRKIPSLGIGFVSTTQII